MEKVTHNLKLTFIKERETISETITFITPADVSRTDVVAALRADHRILMDEFKGRYDLRGCHPRVLTDYTCRKKGWSYKAFKFDDYVSFDAFDR